MNTIVFGVAAWLLGSIPFALLLGFWRGVDLRKSGSGNPGATNLGRNVGFSWGVVAFLLDAAKGWAPVFLAPLLLESATEQQQLLFAGVAILGHCFSPFLGFRGGKGVATAAGALTALAPMLSLALLAVWGIALAIFRTVGIASCVAALASVGLGVWQLTLQERKSVGTLLVAAGILILYRHRSNIARFLRPAT